MVIRDQLFVRDTKTAGYVHVGKQRIAHTIAMNPPRRVGELSNDEHENSNRKNHEFPVALGYVTEDEVN